MQLNLIPSIETKDYEIELTCIESHTQGEALRLVIGGVPELKGNNMIEVREYFEKNYDYIRTALMYEPRGHNDMFGAVLMPAVHPDAQFGIFFMNPDGYIDMCGHGTIAAATDLVEARLVEVAEPVTEIRFETGAGIVSARVHVEKGHAVNVELNNVPAFVYREGLTTVVDGKEYNYDISFGGDFFTMVNADQIGLEICQENASYYIELGMKMLKAVNEEVEISHPLVDIRGSVVCEFYSEKKNEKSDMKNIVVFGNYQADRSPCGTGTSAKMALLYKHGRLGINETIVNESFIGSLFEGKLTGETMAGDFPAVYPVITGQANVLGVSKYLVDAKDRLKYGFQIH